MWELRKSNFFEEKGFVQQDTTDVRIFGDSYWLLSVFPDPKPNLFK